MSKEAQEARDERRLRALIRISNSRSATRFERALAWSIAERLASKLDVILL